MRGKASLLVTVVLGSIAAGCAGNVAPEADPSRPLPRPCEHPWPCADGSEWPTDLVPPPIDTTAFAGFAPAGAEVVERGETHVTLRWLVPTVDAYDPGGIFLDLRKYTKIDVRLPAGLPFVWTLTAEFPADADGRSYRLFVHDEKDDRHCNSDHDATVAGVAPTGDTEFGCTFGPMPPLAEPASYVIELQHLSDRAGDEIAIIATLILSDPVLPYKRLEVERVRVPMRDGVELDGAIWRLDLPESVRAPVVLTATPYASQCPAQQKGPVPFQECGSSVASAARLGGDYAFGGLLDQGYAVAVFSVRGTGASGGCYDAWGSLEQADMLDLVEWLGAQPWSNGRVGMTGLSYSGTTPWEAVIMKAPALKAIVVGGIISDVYLGGFTPQGAANDGSLYFHSSTVVGNSFMPDRDDADALQRFLSVGSERACPGTERQLVAHQEGALTDARDATWFGERRLLDRFPDVTAAPLVLHGFEDDNFHRYQDDIIWDALPNAPKGMVLGQWDHDTYLEPFLEGRDGPRSWYEMERAWFDYWLKGLGQPPAEIGAVSYQDSAGAWRATSAWPPPEARFEALYLADGALATEAGSGTASFRATRSPTATSERTGNPDWCSGESLAKGDDPRWTTFVSEPLTADVLVAGNPMAYLELSSDLPGGVVTLDLYALDPDGGCTETLSDGAADLRFHDGVMKGHDFPMGAPTPVRLDLYSAATLVPAGSRLLVVLSGGGYDYKQGQVQYEPEIAVGGASHLVLPLVEGSLGGGAPTIEYPPRPFTPPAR